MALLLNPLTRLAKIAEGELDAHESPKGSNTGEQLRKYFAADNYKPNTADNGYPWCAAFVSWCVQQFLHTPEGLQYRVAEPRLSAAFAFAGDWATKNGCLILTPEACKVGELWPSRGDIVVYAFSHVGIVSAVSLTGDRHFSAIEGNTDDAGGREGWEVARRVRTFGAVRAWVRMSPRGFVAAGGKAA